MKTNPTKQRLHWLSWEPTPYNDFLFSTLAQDRAIALTVHFRERGLASHPWRSTLVQDYSARFYKPVLGVDWHLLVSGMRERDAFFMIAGWDHPTAVILINLLSLMGTRFALWTDTPDLKRKRHPFFSFLRSRWLKWVFGKATKVMGTGRPGVDALREMGAPENKLVVFPFFLDLHAFAREPEPFSCDENRPIRFISSGRIKNSLKGHDLAIRALAVASQRTGVPFEYYIAGVGPDEQELMRLSAELGIERRVTFLGWVEPGELLSHYHHADVLIHSSPIHDPFPNAVLEGMAAGLVVLGSDASGSVKDRIEHGVNGFIHAAGTSEILAEQIEFLMKNPQCIAELGRRAHATALQWPIERGISTIREIVFDVW